MPAMSMTHRQHLLRALLFFTRSLLKFGFMVKLTAVHHKPNSLEQRDNHILVYTMSLVIISEPL